MIPGPEATVARATTLLALIKAKAVHASRLLVYIVLHYGIDAARRMAELFARMSHRILLRLRPTYRCLQRPQDLQHQVRALLARWAAALALALNGQTLRLIAMYLVTVGVQRSCTIPGTADKGTGLYLRIIGGLFWIQLGARKPQLPRVPHYRSWWPAAEASSAQADILAPEEAPWSPVQQIERESMQRVPLLTSSTESFRSGLTGYAQLESPRKTSPQKATKAVSERAGRRLRLDSDDMSSQDPDCVDRAYAKIAAMPNTAAAFQNLAVHRSASVEGASRILAPNTRAISPGDSRPATSIMKKVARSKGARVAASLDTGTVLRDLLQTVAPETPDSTGSSSSGTSGKGALRTSTASIPSAVPHAQKENTGAWR